MNGLQQHRLDRPDYCLAVNHHAQLQVGSLALVPWGHLTCALDLHAAISQWLYRSKSGEPMLRRTFLLVLLLFFSSGSAWSAAVLDATGRSITVPEHISHVLPAGPPAAILLAAVAPDLMLGWPS